MVYSPCFKEISLPDNSVWSFVSYLVTPAAFFITTRICLELYVASAFVFTSALCSKVTRK